MHRLTIALLGTPKITVDGKPVETDRHKAIGLLAYLVTDGKPHSREALAALLWPDYPRTSAFSYLRRTLWELNRILGKGWIQSDRETVTIVHSPHLELDIETFQCLLDPPSNQVNGLTDAISLYRGDFLEGLVIADTLPFEEWQSQQAEYYRREFARALEMLVTALEQSAEYERALPHAQRWLALDRLNEAAYRAIMRLMAGMGDRSGAVRMFQTCEQTMKNELGVQPQVETVNLYQSILHEEQAEAHANVEQELTPKSPRKVSGNLPSPTTPFIGRSDEIEHIRRLTLDGDIHLLTLIGPGGTGKTRLSIQVAAGMDGSFTDGVWFIPLAPVQSAQGLIGAIANGLNFSFNKSAEPPRVQLMDYLREKQILLILDNFEHLLKGGRELVADILGTAQDVKLLVTSRERLNLQMEQIYRVSGMRIPELSTITSWENPTEQAKPYSAIQLLLERARRVRPDFELRRENLTAVTQICRLVDGSPLGIELAVTWLELLPPDEIVREITNNLDFLESNAADVPERQRSLRAVFDTSWKLLNEEEQKAFQRLSVFKGRFTRQAAQEVSGATIQTLLRLANKSWMQQGESGYYQLHEVMRQFGMERLQADPNEWQKTKDKHADFYSTFLQVHGQALRTSTQIQALEALKSELDSNIPEAWEWIVSSGQIDMLIEKMLMAVFHYWQIRSGIEEFLPIIKQTRKAASEYTERNYLLQQTILETVETNFESSGLYVDEKPKQHLEQLWRRVRDHNLEDEMGIWYIVLIATYGGSLNFEEGSQRLMEIVPKFKTFRDPWELGVCYLLAGQFLARGELEKRKKYLSEALAIFQKIGVIHEQGITLVALGDLAARELDYETAISYTQKGKQYYELAGDYWGADYAWSNLGEYYIYLGKIDQAFNACEELRHFSEKVGNRRMLGIDYSWESLQVSRYGKLDYALELRKKSLEIAIEVKNQNDIAWHTWELGEIYRLMGELEQAKKYYQEALPLFEKLQDHLGLGFYHRGYGDIALMVGNWEEARSEFQEALTNHEKEQRNLKNWGQAYYHARLGIALVHLGAFGEAKLHLKTSLSRAEDWAHPDMNALPLTGIATLLANNGYSAEAIEIAACVINKPTTWHEVKQQASIILEMARQTLPPDDAMRAQEQGESLDIAQISKRYIESPLLGGDVPPTDGV